jgi:hypothetical protein
MIRKGMAIILKPEDKDTSIDTGDEKITSLRRTTRKLDM